MTLSDKTYTPPKVIGYGTADVKDGVMDDAYLASDVITVDALCLIDEEEYVDPVLMNVLAKAQCRLLWDEENLYVYFEVKDPTPSSFISEGYNNNDCFVMWVDFNHGGPILDYRSGKQEVDVPRAFMFEVSIVDSMNNRIFGTQLADGDMRGVWGDMVKTKMITYFNKNFEGGYAGEMIIPWAEGLTPEVGHIMGVMAGVKDDINDDDSCDYYLYSYEHDLDTYGSDYKYTNGWEHAILSDVTYVAPVDPDEPTETPDEPTETPDEPTETPDEPTETPDEPTETPDEPTEQPPAQTLDAGIVVAVSVMAIAAGVVLTKKK